MRVMTVVGARPQFIKAAPVSALLRSQHEEILVHTGQHYDAAMSDVFFEELGIPAPDVNLGIGSASHAQQTGEMLIALEQVMCERCPECVVVYGDTNTTLAGALAASKLQIPVAHVEAGLRSFNRAMPEELNRVVTDHISDLLLCPAPGAVRNLAAEGIIHGVALVGDVMLDTARRYAASSSCLPLFAELGLMRGEYYLATVHRASNTDSRERLVAIIDAFGGLDRTVVWPLHPRTRKMLAAFGLEDGLRKLSNVRILEPLSYRESLGLLRDARALLTDSGGMQKEAYFLRVPCVTLREETEWTDTVDTGWNTLVGADTERIIAAARAAQRPLAHPGLYGDGHAAERIVVELEKRYGPAVRF